MHVFGYGSLTERGGYPARLRGFRRVWGVAMDNSRDLPGYKHYLAADGSRPALFVAFLDIEPEPNATIAGTCLPVSAASLAQLDARERNYARADVSDAVDLAAGRAWAYVGTAAGRARLAAGRIAGTAVVARAYLERADAALRALGEAVPDLGGLPVRDLRRVDPA